MRFAQNVSEHLRIEIKECRAMHEVAMRDMDMGHRMAAMKQLIQNELDARWRARAQSMTNSRDAMHAEETMLVRSSEAAMLRIAEQRCRK